MSSNSNHYELKYTDSLLREWVTFVKQKYITNYIEKINRFDISM